MTGNSCLIVFLLSMVVLGQCEIGQEQSQQETVDEDAIHAEYEELLERMQKEYANLTLKRLGPGKVGRRVRVTLSDGKSYVVKTLSQRPPIFEIRNYLSDEECDHVIKSAERSGLTMSRTVGEDKALIFVEHFNSNHSVIFKQWDGNGNGEIDMYEAKKYLKLYVDFDINVENVTQMMQDCKLDSNKDGIISFNEFQEINFTDSASPLLNQIIRIKEIRPETKGRHSQQAFVEQNSDPVLKQLQQRLAELARLPVDLIKASEELQVVKYQPGGHYNCHLDSDQIMRKSKMCCHLKDSSPDDCQICRYMTVLYFLNDVKVGGETAFPIADNSSLDQKVWDKDEAGLCNLARNCQKSNLVVTPEKGKAILWYNHYVRKESGWLGQVDWRSYHGGCAVIEGEKWIANNWIEVSPFRQADIINWAQKVIDQKYAELNEDNDNEVKVSDKTIDGDIGNMDAISARGLRNVEKPDHTEL